MNKSKNYLMSLISILMLISCKSPSSNQREIHEQISEIDAIRKVHVVYAVRIDSLGAFKDTISIEKFKNNSEGKKVYEQHIINKITTSSYYDEFGNIFYSKSESIELGLLSVFKANIKKRNIDKATLIEYRQNQPYDTTFMKYDYKYINNKIEKMIISSINNFNKGEEVIKYQNEKPILSYITIDKDTFSTTIFEYSKSHINGKLISNKNDSSSLYINYNKSGNILSEEKFKKGKIIEKSIYHANSDGRIDKKKIIDFPSNDTISIIYSYNVLD